MYIDFKRFSRRCRCILGVISGLDMGRQNPVGRMKALPILGGVATLFLTLNVHAGLFSTSCAARDIDQSYTDKNAVTLIKAVARGDTGKIAELARMPGLVNQLGDGAVPPLLWAICADNIAGFEALLKAGADPNLAGNGAGVGDGAGHGVKESGSIVYEGWSATLMAASAGQPGFLKLALQYGGDANAAKGEREPNRPLLLAAYHGLKENMKVLLAAGADINIHDRQSSAATYALGVTGRFDIAVWLIEQGYSHDLQGLASRAEISHVPIDGEQQRWKEKLIGMLRARGAVFPASPGVRRAIAIEREIPQQDIDDIVLGRRSVFDYPKRKN